MAAEGTHFLGRLGTSWVNHSLEGSIPDATTVGGLEKRQKIAKRTRRSGGIDKTQRCIPNAFLGSYQAGLFRRKNVLRNPNFADTEFALNRF
jgi:hypothetical protein